MPRQPPPPRRARTVLDIPFHRLVTWLAPILPFTMELEDVWLSRFPGEQNSVHLQDFLVTPADWLNEPLARKWDGIRRARRAVTAALEIKRSDKVIGASLEASPVVHVEDKGPAGGAEIGGLCRYLHHPGHRADRGLPPPGEAFRLPDVAGIGVVFESADGEKCERCWKILPDVGSHKHPGTCARCDEVLSHG